MVAVWYRRLWWAVDELVANLTTEQLSRLRVRVGEHLAAILTTAFLQRAHARVDTAGDVDLWFDLSGVRGRTAEIIPAQVSSAAFEVKSLAGGFRGNSRPASTGIRPAAWT